MTKTQPPNRKKSPPKNGNKAIRPQKGTAARSRFGRLIGGLFYWSAVAAVWGVIVGAGIIAYYAYTLPNVDAAFSETRKPSVTILAADGTELATVGQVYGAAVDIRDVPPQLPEAIMAIEDRRFRTHFGIDPIGLARAMWANIKAGHIVQGGSTITQQVAKNLFLTPDRTIKRKIQEVLLALWLENRFSKDQIMTVYLNRVYLGNGSYGVDAAARRYFGVPAASLSTYQSAMLAGMLKAPSRLNPIADADAADARARVVLQAMVDAGYLNEAQAKKSASEKSRFIAPARGGGSRYFVDWIMDRISGYVSVDKDLIVRTTFQPYIQHAAEKSIDKRLAESRSVTQGAALVMTPDGAVEAMVGGKSYAQSQFNRATQALRQPGSAFKPIVYLAALEDGFHPSDIVVDGPVDINGWRPENFEHTYEGKMRLDYALAHSVNTVAVKLAQHAGWGKIVQTAKRLGITTNVPTHPSIALGAAEVTLIDLTSVYATFANGGYGVWPHAIVRITDTDGNLLYDRKGGGPGRVMAARDARTMSQMLEGVIRSGTGKRAALDRPAAGKTGTSQEHRDGWFVGYTADTVTGVWMGNDDGRPAGRLVGGSLPAEAWHDIMTVAEKDKPVMALNSLPMSSGQSVQRDENGIPVVSGDKFMKWFGGLFGKKN